MCGGAFQDASEVTIRKTRAIFYLKREEWALFSEKVNTCCMKSRL
jgi:hypothetical protein